MTNRSRRETTMEMEIDNEKLEITIKAKDKEEFEYLLAQLEVL